MINELHKEEDYNPSDWISLNTFTTIKFLYDWGWDLCERVIETKAAKELLEKVKNTEFDVIVQDVTLNQCLYGLWEVDK